MSFFVTVEAFARQASLVVGSLHGLGHISFGWPLLELPCSIYVHRDGDIIIASWGVQGVVRGLISQVGLVLSWSPVKVPKPWAIVWVLSSNRWGRGPKYCIKATHPAYHDSSSISHLLPGVGV